MHKYYQICKKTGRIATPTTTLFRQMAYAKFQVQGAVTQSLSGSKHINQPVNFVNLISIRAV